MTTVKAPTHGFRPCTRRLTAALTLACVFAGVPAVHAQEPGVVYEPGSPSDKEYAIPLQEARRDAGGERPGKLEALPFGIGLSRKGGAGGAGTRPGRAPRSGASDRGRGEVTQPGRASRSRSRDFGDRLADAEAAGAPSLWALGPLLLVLLPALLLGLLLARRYRRQPAT